MHLDPNLFRMRKTWAALLLIGSCIVVLSLIVRGDFPRYCLPQPSGDAVYVPLHDQIAVLTKTEPDPVTEQQFSSLRWYQARDGRYLDTDLIHPSTSLQVSPDGATMMVLGVDSIVRWYSATTREVIAQVPLLHPNTPFAVDAMGAYLANARPEHGIDLIRVADNAIMDTFPTELQVTHLSFHPTEPILVVAEGDKLSFWDTATLERIQDVASDNTSKLAFSQRGTKLAKAEIGPGLRASRYESHITVSEIVAGTTATETTYVVPDLTSTLAFRPDGRRLAIGGGYPPSILLGEWPWVRRQITIVDTERNGQIVDRVRTPFRAIIDIAYSADGALLTVVGADVHQQRRICVWDTA